MDSLNYTQCVELRKVIDKARRAGELHQFTYDLVRDSIATRVWQIAQDKIESGEYLC